jgi:cell division protein FtsW
VTGTGFGEGGGRLGYIPELYNDFVAASVGEEFGLVGLGLLAVLYILFVWRGMAISRNAKDTFGAYLAFGITMLIGVQAAINLCVVTGVLPTKGLTLPFVSYGRSSLILLLFAVGVLQNIAQCNPDFYKMRLDDLKVQDAAAEKRSKAERTRERRRRRKLKELGADD